MPPAHSAGGPPEPSTCTLRSHIPAHTAVPQTGVPSARGALLPHTPPVLQGPLQTPLPRSGLFSQSRSVPWAAGDTVQRTNTEPLSFFPPSPLFVSFLSKENIPTVLFIVFLRACQRRCSERPTPPWSWPCWCPACKPLRLGFTSNLSPTVSRSGPHPQGAPGSQRGKLGALLQASEQSWCRLGRMPPRREAIT